MIKAVIASGCSFTEGDHSWPSCLKRSTDLYVLNCGVGSSSNGMIRKRAMYNCTEMLKQYKPEEICIIAMWSGSERQEFWVDHPNAVETICNGYKEDLQSELQYIPYYEFTCVTDMYHLPDGSRGSLFNKEWGDARVDLDNPGNTQGWHVENYATSKGSIPWSQAYFDLNAGTLGPSIQALENMVYLQSFCKAMGVNLYHCFYRTYVYQDIVENKDNVNLNYLYNLLDKDNIISELGPVPRCDIDNSVLDNEDLYLNLQINDAHPTTEEYEVWVNETLLPFLKDRKLL